MRRLALRRLCHDLGPGARYFTAMPLGAVPCYSVALATLTAGGAVVLPNPGVAFIDLANALDVTMTTVSPGLLAELLDRERGGARRLDTMTCLNVVGANLPRQLLQDVDARLTSSLRVSYGASEIDVAATATGAICAPDPSAAGFVVPWVDAEIVDAVDHPLGIGDEGLLRLRGEGMVAGYYRDDAATRRNFRDGWFYPGDIGAITAEGLLRITGRVEELIVRDGITVSPLPIEEAMRGLPGVRDVAVFALAAGGTEQVCAALLLDAGADVARIRTEAAARLGDQAPARLFVIDKLPRNANGKLMRRELVAMAERSVQR
jgi:acyl-CoA synthetase (AMP-forming)/AMP-acid ligase II